MYSNLPDNYETIMAGARRIWYEGTITTVAEDVYEFNASNIVTGTGSINRRITDGTSLAIGSVTAAQFDIKLFWTGIDRYELYDAEISVTCYIENGNQSPIEIPMGVFYVNEVTQDATTISITAYDAMLKFDIPYVHTVATNAPSWWLTQWCSTCGVTLGTSPMQIIYTMPNGGRQMTLDIDAVSDITTYRDALSYLCSALCAVAVIGRDNKLYIMNYDTTVAKTFNQSQRYSSTLSDYVCYYTHMTSVYGETVEHYVDTSYTGEDDGITLDIDVNPFLQIADVTTRATACQAILTKLATVHYAPYEVTLPTRPELDIMDVIGWTGGQADEQDFGPIMDITYNFDSPMSIECVGDNPKTIKENKYVKTIKSVSRLTKQNDDFAGLLANAYGMYRTEIEDPVSPGSYAYALHNASTYNTSTFAMLVDASGLHLLRRNSVLDNWTISSASASDGSAFVEVLTANSAVISALFSQDITVSGALHSTDYVPAASGASPPYSNAGMGLDFGDKEFEAENFAIDASGNLYAKGGKIGPFNMGFYTTGNTQLPYLYSDWVVYAVSATYYRTRICLRAPYIYNNLDAMSVWLERQVATSYDPQDPESAVWGYSTDIFSISSMGALSVEADIKANSTIKMSNGGGGVLLYDPTDGSPFNTLLGQIHTANSSFSNGSLLIDGLYGMYLYAYNGGKVEVFPKMGLSNKNSSGSLAVFTSDNPEFEIKRYDDTTGDLKGTVRLQTNPTSGSVLGMYVKNETTGTTVQMGVGSTGVNHGIFSNTLSKWMLVGDSNTGEVKVNGLANGIDTSPTYTAGSNVSIATATWTDTQTVSLAAGTWIVTYGVSFGSNATGYRTIALTTSATAPSQIDRTMPTVGAVNGAATIVVNTTVVSHTSTTTYHLWAYQNSGSARSSYPWVRTTRLK